MADMGLTKKGQVGGARGKCGFEPLVSRDRVAAEAVK